MMQVFNKKIGLCILIIGLMGICSYPALHVKFPLALGDAGHGIWIGICLGLEVLGLILLLVKN
ncbi:MAG: hypothetical protein V4641_23315 [Pseudomonadota bacterium]